MNYNNKDVAGRLKATREYLDITTEIMAEKTYMSPEEYTSLENGEKDLSLSFLNECANAFHMELIELLTGTTPTLRKYSIVRSEKGLPIDRREGFSYSHLAYLFKNKKIEPLLVTAPYCEDEQGKPIHLSTHDGHEMNYIISGEMRFIISGKEEILKEGDCVYFDAKNLHGMIAVGGKECKFLAILI
ncbi:MAG: XRE family transcriptional regulator [Oscillospiraceae bacterium]|nr:XRE family transcriptional regulator [Oscillospiraceae bacterium]